VRSDSAEFFGYFLPKKLTTRTNIALRLRHGVGRDAPGLGWQAGRESRATPVAPDSCPAAIGHGGAVSLHHCCRDMPPACPLCVCVELNLDLRLWGVVDHSTTQTRAATPKPAPRGIGGCVRREASIEGVRFRCKA
jgi:hypothetical protein